MTPSEARQQLVANHGFGALVVIDRDPDLVLAALGMEQVVRRDYIGPAPVVTDPDPALIVESRAWVLPGDSTKGPADG